MNKQELIKAVQASIKDNGFEFTQEEVNVAVTSLVNVIKDVVVDGGRVKLPEIGTFSSKDTKARVGRNPQTGDEIEIPASKKVTFKVDESFKKTIKA